MDRYGAGAFGHWDMDEAGKPVYVYTMDHARDPRAVYNTSLGPSRDHWHQVGTGEFVTTVHNGGHCQIYDWSRGGKCLNRWDPANGHFSGGFLLVELDGEAFSTLWEGLPVGAIQERRWGCNYAERVTRYKGIEITERIGAHPCEGLKQAWRVENLARAEARLRVCAPWWINPHLLTPAPLMTNGLRRVVDARRARLRRWHDISVDFMDLEFDDAPLFLRSLHAHFRMRGHVPYRPLLGAGLGLIPRVTTKRTCSPLLVALPLESIERDDKTGLPRRILPPQVLPLKKQGVYSPQMELTADCDDTLGHLGRFPAVGGVALAAVYDLELAAGRVAEEHLLVSVSQDGAGFREDAPSRAELESKPSPHELRLEVPGSDTLARELRWHAAYLQGGAHASGYHGTRFVDQGSAYSYLQGLSGAPRDFALFILPMVYLNPGLAKDMLRHLFACQHYRSGKLPYANVLNGRQRGYGLHSYSSDLDLFLMWAAAEYLGATQDWHFLEERVLYFPRGKRKRGGLLDHLQRSFAHLRDRVGLGPHGMLRCGTGDWNDVLLGFSRLPPLTLWRGESSLNAGLAALALPRLADVLEGVAPAFAAELRAVAAGQAEALKQMWTGRWAARGYLGYGGKKLGEDRLFLDTQAFGVLAGVWDMAQRTALFDAIDELCFRPQQAGALALWPPMKGPLLVPGSDTNGGTWAAIDALTVWAWAQHDPARAWAFYQSTTLAARAEAYPDVWYGVWSGPDSFNAHYHPRPGETFCHNFTPMTDFPVMNMNRHAGPLLDAVKFAGIEPRGGALEIRPRVPVSEFRFESVLICLHQDENGIRGEYTPVCEGTFRFRVATPFPEARLQINGVASDVVPDAGGMVAFEVDGTTGRTIRWSLGR